MADNVTFTDADNIKRTAAADDIGGGVLRSRHAVDSLPLPPGAATEETLATVAKQGAPITGETLGAGGSGVLGWMSQISSWLRLRLPAALGANGGLKIELASGATLVLPAGAATEMTIAAILARIDGPSQNVFSLADMTLSTSPVQLTARSCREVMLLPDSANAVAANVLVGDATNQRLPLAAGQPLVVPVVNTDVLWVKAASGSPVLHLFARD